MTSEGLTPRNTPVRLSESALRKLAQQLRLDGSPEVAALIQAILVDLRQLEVLDLWEPREAALTYWVLMLTGVNQSDELQIAGDVLTWQAFLAKDSARVLCVQASERDAFRCCSSQFEVHDCPTLLMSDVPDMSSLLKIEPDLLRGLASQPGELQRFLTRLHALAENGRSLEQLQQLLAADAFWRGMKVVYKELRGLISITLSP